MTSTEQGQQGTESGQEGQQGAEGGRQGQEGQQGGQEGQQGGQEGQQGGQEGQQGTEDTGGRNKALRERAQAAEARVTELEATVAAYRLDEVTRAATAAGMVDARDFLAHHAADDFLDEETGRIDHEALTEALDGLRSTKRHLFRGGQRPAPDRSQGSSAKGSPSHASTGETWQKVLSGRR